MVISATPSLSVSVNVADVVRILYLLFLRVYCTFWPQICSIFIVFEFSFYHKNFSIICFANFFVQILEQTLPITLDFVFVICSGTLLRFFCLCFLLLVALIFACLLLDFYSGLSHSLPILHLNFANLFFSCFIPLFPLLCWFLVVLEGCLTK